MLASPSPFHPQQMASGMLHRPESTPSDLVHPPPGLLGFRPLGQEQRLQTQDNEEEDMNGSEMDSDIGSENDDINDIDSEKLDASHKEILEKLKRQEQEEREEIERELKEAQREALVNAQRHEEIRAQELRALEEQERAERGLEEMMGPLQTEIKMQRPLGLLAQHGLKSRAHLCDRDREPRVEKTEKDSPSKEREKTQEKEAESCDRDRPLSLTLDRDRPLPLSLPLPRPDLDFPHPAFMDSRGFGPPSSHPESPRSIGTPGLDGSGSTGAQTPAGHHWTFEEQFKQLYELSDDPKRREFLDDLFCYMQKRGTPVNRIPIMAKQTLDLYELFRLVVSKGGLVEVINKKLWREITKGLNLPSSITSAAFTLRTQYMKYLYPYECEKLKLSNPAELQAAIDGNRREGRRPSYGYDFSPIPTMIPTPPGPHLNGGFHHGHPLNGRPTLGTPPKEEDHLLGSLHMANLAERDARAMEAAARAMEEATKRMEEARVAKIPPPTLPVTSVTSKTSTSNTPPTKLPEPPLGGPPLKRPLLDEERFMAHLGMPSTHLKITSRGDGRNEFDNSMVVSMEINGIMYQGVLFAQHGHPRRI